MGGVWPAGVTPSWGRTDQGIDGTITPGTPALAIAPGTVQILHDPSGFGQNYAVLNFDQPLSTPCGTFHSAYYGHLFPDVGDGTHVNEGDRVAHAGQQGGGNASAETGGFELGFWAGGPAPNTGQCATQYFKGLAPGVPVAGGAGGGAPCKGCGFTGISFDLQSAVDSAVGSTVSPDVGGPICVLTGCQEKALKAGLITFAGALVMGLGVILIAHWGLHDTKTGQAVGRSANKAMGLVGILGGPEGLAATETLSHLTRSRQPQASTQRTKPRPTSQTQTAGQLPGETPGAYEEYQQSGRQPSINGDTPSYEQTPETYLEKMGA